MLAIRRGLDIGYYEYVGETKYYTDYTRAVFNALITFVTDCSFSTSKNIRFICANWYCSYSELCNKWQGVSGKSKTSDAFRSQVSTTSMFLYEIFPNFHRDVFLLEEEFGLNEINRIISALSGEDLSLADLFISEVINYCDNFDNVLSFSLEDCLNEISAIKALKRSEVFSFLDTLDWEKLRYVLYVLSKPISSSRSREVNHEKIDMLRLLDESSSSVVSASELGSFDENTNVRLSKKYSIGITPEMEAILIQRLAEPDRENESSNSSASEIEKIQRFFGAYTEDSFRERISKLNKYDLAVALEQFKY